MKIILPTTLLFLTLACFPSMAQDPDAPERNKNLIHGQGGFLGPDLLISFTGWYERLIWPTRVSKPISIFGRIGWRSGQDWLISPVNEPVAQVGLLTGKKTWHFEFALGGTPEKLADTYTLSVSGGLRYQEFSKPLVIRAGLGFPEGVYAGLGFSF